MDSLVDTAWLTRHLADADLVVLDCSVQISMVAGAMTMVSGRAEYEARHIPGAGFADLIVDLSDDSQSIGFAVPSPEEFCEAMGRLGVGDDSRVVLYDTAGSMWAARVWWMLRWVGFDRAAILDGGLGAWSSTAGALATDTTVPSPQTLTPSVRGELIADQAEVLAALDDDGVRLVDTLMADHFDGRIQMYDRPGHLPGAINVPVFDLLDETGRVCGSEQTTELHGGRPEARTITYCGGGIAASLSAFALVRAGYDDVAVYTASLQEWAADPDLPLTMD